MIVAVTGATGAVGARLVRRHLDAGDRVRVLSRRPPAAGAVEAFRADLADSGADVTRFVDGADVLYHCAAETLDPSRMHRTNVEGTRRLAEAARGRVGRWVQLSSIAVYGSPRDGIFDESAPCAPTTPYGASKAAAEAAVEEAGARGGYPWATVRPAKVFGAGLEGGNTAILRRLIAAIDAGLFFFVGRPGAMAHYVPIDNLVEALALCARAPAAAGRVYNLSDECGLEDFVGLIAHALGRPRTRLRLPEAPARGLARLLGWIPGFPLTAARVDALSGRARFPADRIAGELGYRPPEPLPAALRELVAEWRRTRRP